MTDKEIISIILKNSIIIVTDFSIVIKKEIYNKLITITKRRDTLVNTMINKSFALFLENDTQYMIRYTSNYIETKECFNDLDYKNTIILLPENIPYLFKFYDNNLSTKESIEDLLNNINIKEQIKNKEEILKRLYEK